MIVTVIQIDPEVGPERFGPWLGEAGAQVRLVRAWEEPLPAVSELTALVVLGGRMNAYDDAATPCLPPLVDLLRAASLSVPTLAICLGHQLLARAAGGTVEVGSVTESEAGATQICWAAAAADDPLLAAAVALGRQAWVAMSHHDVVSVLPPPARALASSHRHANQVFRVGTAVGVQFHPEASPELMHRWKAADATVDLAAIDAGMAAHDDEIAALGRALAHSLVRLAR